MLTIEVAGEAVRLSSNFALHLVQHDTAVVADLHWGKSATFRSAGVPLPGGTTLTDLERLTRVLDEAGVGRLVIVGDLLHAKAGRDARTLDAIARWRDAHRDVEMVLVRGNHDIRAGDPPAEWRIDCVNGPVLVGRFALQHHPGEHATHYVLAGHLHPHAVIRGRGRQAVRLPCFAFGERGAVLPAFTSFTGGGAYVPAPGDRLFVVAEGEVIPAGVSGGRST